MQWQEHLKLISDAASVSLAIFFHDVIYDPKAGSPQHLGTFRRYIQFHFSLESDIRTKSRGCRLSVSTHDERFEVVHLKLELLPVQWFSEWTSCHSQSPIPIYSLIVWTIAAHGLLLLPPWQTLFDVSFRSSILYKLFETVLGSDHLDPYTRVILSDNRGFCPKIIRNMVSKITGTRGYRGILRNEIDSADVFDHFVQEALPGGSERGFRAMKAGLPTSLVSSWWSWQRFAWFLVLVGPVTCMMLTSGIIVISLFLALFLHV